MKKITFIKRGYILVLSVIFLLLLFLYPKPYTLNPTYAQTTLCGSLTTQPRAEGLVTTKSLTGKFYTSSGACIIDEKTSFVSFRVPSYDTLKSLYFTQAKESASLKKITIAGDATQGSFTLSTNSVVEVKGNLTLSGNISGSSTGIVFIDGKLDITQDFIYGGGNYGVVFVVKGNVVIAPTVTRVDGVIISNGTIYTAGEFCSTSSTSAPQLTVNGSLISLDPNNKIRFCRNLTDNSQPAEIVNHQPKYVVILRNILWERLKKYTEITGAAPPTAPTPAPTTAATPTPTPLASPTPTPTPAPTPGPGGPNSPTTADLNASCSGTAWANPGNVLSSNSVYASVTLSNDSSNCILARGFGFSIPSTATITGVKVEIEGKAASQQIQAWLYYGNLHFSRTATLTTTESYVALGGATDLWDEPGFWTPARINDPTFGAAVRVYPATTDTVYIDHMRVTVYYSP